VKKLFRCSPMNWRRFLAGKDAGFWLFISLAFFGSMIWAKSRDPFKRIWFTVNTQHYGKVKGVAVLPVGVGQSFQPAREKGTTNIVSKRGRQDALPYVFYIYGSGGSLINSGNELRQLAELGMAAVAIEYNQTNQAAFEEQFIAVRKELEDRRREIGVRNQNAECWIGFSLGAERTLRLFLKAAGGTPALPLPNLYVRMSGGMPEEFKVQSPMFNVGEHSALDSRPSTRILLVHGGNDEIFPVDEAKEAAAFFKTNGFPTELKILPGKSHGFDADRALVFRTVGERIKAQLTPEHPLPEFPVTKNYSYVLCILPAFLWAGFWIYSRRKMGGTGDSPVVAGESAAITQCETHGRDARATNIEHRKLKKWEIGLCTAAVVLATMAIAETGIHLITPRLQVSDATLRIARKWLLAPKWHEDFETLSAKPFWRGQQLQTLLTHVELANYCVYELINWKVDKAIYNDYVLSPVIDEMDSGMGVPTARIGTHGRDARATTEPELNWRRPLWEFFYPRVRHEDTPEAAAEIVARTLRERITVVNSDAPDVYFQPKHSGAGGTPTLRPGIETIWRNQITDEKGFQRIYVATLRSVGVGARLNSDGNAEFWTGSEWKTAPHPLIMN
jgi:predicted esterase